MNITITFEHADLIKYVRDMLAAKGLKPKGEIEFRQQKGGKTYIVIVDCVPGPVLDVCPMCHSQLINGAPVAEPTMPVKQPAEVEREYPVAVPKDEEEFDTAVIDPELGETFDPPSPGEGAPSVSVSRPSNDEDEEGESGGGSMASLLAANRRLTAQRTRELEERKRTSGRSSSSMAGESTRPPKPGEGV